MSIEVFSLSVSFAQLLLKPLNQKSRIMTEAPILDAAAIEFADNSEPRCPCILLLDTSSSMSGEPINALNEGLRTFKNELMIDNLAKKRVEVAIVTFDSQRSFNSF